MPHRKIIWSLVAVVATALALSNIVDQTSQQQADEALTNALITFAVSRTLNGVISVAQGTELALEPGGVGVVLSLGQVLDPVNDLVERFSTVMLIATSSIGLQNLLLRISEWWGLTLMLGAAAAFTLACLWLPGFNRPMLRQWATRLLLLTLFLRFAVPGLVLTSALIFDVFLADEQIVATQALETTRDQIEVLNEQAEHQSTDESVMGKLGTMFNGSLDAINPKEQIDRLQSRVSNAVEHIINLIVIFMLQTVLLPIGFLWLVTSLLKSAVERLGRM
ncbi:MAG: hypothetical protein OEU86_05185 [Gammaproteobacteria bacterium]|nr:hypothetical protein [Gammaproteobacteria bacterium]